jgi:hypothetical protein
MLCSFATEAVVALSILTSHPAAEELLGLFCRCVFVIAM